MKTKVFDPIRGLTSQIMMRLRVGFGSRKINIKARKLSFKEQFVGLMFKSKNSENLLFDLPGKWGVHSFFVFFPFLALWLNEKNKVIGHKIVKPFTFYVNPGKKFARLVEIPLNDKNKAIISVFPSIKGKV